MTQDEIFTAIPLWQCLDLQWFSAEEEGRTEKPSETKLKKAREEGRVPKSQDLNSTLVLLVAIIVLIILAPYLMRNFVEIIRFYFLRCTTAEFNKSLFKGFLHYYVKMVAPIGLSALVAGVLGNIIQNKGFIYSTKPLKPNFSKLIPKIGEYLKKTLFSPEGAFNVVKSLLKVAAIVFIAFITIKSDVPTMFSLMKVNIWLGFTHIAGMIAKLLIYTAIIFLIVSVPDYLVQRYQFMEQMKMSKQDVKEEFKNMEGDPLIKSKIRQYTQELISGNMRQQVAESDVVITNPTHFAVALKYEGQAMQAPQVSAKGQDNMAQQIKKIARENDVPIIENRPLARALYAEVEIGDIIPESYYRALATIFSKVYSMKAKK